MFKASMTPKAPIHRNISIKLCGSSLNLTRYLVEGDQKDSRPIVRTQHPHPHQLGGSDAQPTNSPPTAP